MRKPGNTPDILKPMLRGMPLIVLAVIAGILIARRYLRYATPMFESTAKIKLADSRDGIPNSNLYKDFDVFTSSNKIGAEVEVLKSQALMAKVVERLQLEYSIYRVGDIHTKELYGESPLLLQDIELEDRYMDRPFEVVLHGRTDIVLTLPDGKTIQARVGVPVRIPGAAFVLHLNAALLQARPGVQVDDHYRFLVHSKEKQVHEIIAGLDVMAVDKDIPVLRISYKCPVAARSADIVNAVAESYIADYIEEKYRSADTTGHFLSDQLDAYSEKLRNSEGQIQQFRDDKNIINIHQETETDLRKVADLKKQLASVKMNLEAVDSLNTYIRKAQGDLTRVAPNFEAFNDLLSTEMVKDMKRLQAEKKDLLTRFTPENEKVTVIDDKISDLSKYLQESIRNTEANLQIKYNDLEQTIASAEAAFSGLPAKERNMTVLERNFSLNEQIYRFLQEKKTDAEIAKAANISFHRIISRGEVPALPVSPNAKLVTVFCGFLGLIFSIAGIYTVHYAKGRVDNEQNIFRHTDSHLSCAIPYCKTKEDKEAAFRRWMLELELKQMLRPGTLITLSSFRTREGKSFIASGIARACSDYDKSVLLVTLNREVTAGQGYAVLNRSELPQSWCLPDVWNGLTERWRKEYDVVVISNLEAGMPESMLGMSAAVQNFFVLDSRMTRTADIVAADELKERLGATGWNFVLNRAGYIPSIWSQLRSLVEKGRK